MTQNEALAILKTGANVFLTGEPGSGKTHTVNAYIAWLRSHGIDPAITASTGIAATHVGGMTLHAWAGIGIAERMTPQLLDAIASKEHVAKRLQRAKVLIIDEVSMLSANVLSMVDEVAREVRHEPHEAFGGLQVVFVGDFFQLPPVSRTETSFAFESPAWANARPMICYLSEQHRQDDERLLDVLSAIRGGTWDHTHVSIITAREAEFEVIEDGIPQLFTHNADVDRMNEERLSRLSGKEHVYLMQSAGTPALTEALKRGCLSPERLVLKEGAVVMATKNNPIAGYSNGTLGTVIDFESGTDFPIIETRDGREITVQPVDWAVEENAKVRAKLTQFPLRLAWAITVHKSQGQSLDAAAIDLSRAFEHGQGYVALSRVRRLDGLFLLGWSEMALSVHPRVSALDVEFREASAAAAEAFAELEESGERKQMEKNFILASGGTLESKEGTAGAIVPKATTYDLTLALIEAGKTLVEIAKERSLTIGTIADHADKLVSAGRVTASTLEEIIPDRLKKALPKIFEAFEKKGAEKLTPAYSTLKGKYSYDELKLARVLFLRRA
ncbi:MAG: ATP-dependent DNA helicase PIF1 [Parcubacteria bacterium C7867-004]|nr:MAG: ATP-dependent DNA helicase PIF1 [Parcubacteria bacterium C7867-004]